MCGISGIWAPGDAARWQPLLDGIVASQHSRGPDFEATRPLQTRGATLLLGHNRLSIIDLSDAAHQPMWDVDRRACIVFNGEIYNYRELRVELEALGHRFATQSDTEVILAAYLAWGPDAVLRFNGMFAFALWDMQAETLWLFRDRFGVKPLCYHLDADWLAFASTGGAIARVLGLAPDPAYLARGLRYWVYETDDDRTAYTGLHTLPAGHRMRVRRDAAGALEVHREAYYDLAARVEAQREELRRLPVATLVTRVREQLADAVVLRLRADVPVGVSLSGGLDSASLAALLAERHADVVGFSFGSPADAASEGPLVAELVRKLGIRVEYVQAPPEGLTDALWTTLEAQDAPFLSGSAVAQLLVYRAARAAGVKVLLGGQGGDEDFMGYRKYQAFQLRRWLRGQDPGGLVRGLPGLGLLALAELPQAAGYWRHRHRYTGGPAAPSPLRLPAPEPLALGDDPAAPLWRRQLLDVTRFSLPSLLRYEDRNSMANSVESRLPFLDYRVVELGLGLPDALKLRAGFGKWVLREAMRGRLPESIRAARYKRGFDMGQDAWVAAGLGRQIRERVDGLAGRLDGWLAPGFDVARAFSDQRLQADPAAFGEAMTLIWLGSKLA
ncbi:MAG: hypothetical protein JWM80_6110 [Cyanobacteria bacterium RYN_339]|nr:hypothetical protein [Cyanobacteria bacterium RYN_339]